MAAQYSHWVDSPDDKGKSCNSSEEVANLSALLHSQGTAVNGEMPDDNEIGNAGNSVPAPLLRGALRAEGSEETGKDHDDIGKDGHQDMGAVKTGEKGEIEQKKRSGQTPIDVAGPVDLAVNVLSSVWNVAVLLSDDNVVVTDTVSAGHGEVGQGGEDDNQGGDDVVETLGLGDFSRCSHSI